jgi:hypothetical protein
MKDGSDRRERINEQLGRTYRGSPRNEVATAMEEALS